MRNLVFDGLQDRSPHLRKRPPSEQLQSPQILPKKLASFIRLPESSLTQLCYVGLFRLIRNHLQMKFDPAVAHLIDHTILKPEATREEVLGVCAEALNFEFASVCVNPYWVPLVAGQLRGSPVKVCTVVGFPLGATSTASKVAETLGAIKDGAQEIDMVLNIGALRGGDRDAVESDIRAVVAASHTHGAIVKVILETALLDDNQKNLACRLSQKAGADFVKTSTGFSKAGATVGDITLMRRAVGPSMGVKASGGVRTLADLRAMVAAGATRIGASASVAIVEETAASLTDPGAKP
jgi:deoxyribose-phosphate aldolase